MLIFEQPTRRVFSVKMWKWAWVWACLFSATPFTSSLFVPEAEGQGAGTTVVDVLNRMVQVLETQERHTALYERVALLEETLSKKTETEVRLEAEVLQLRAKIPTLEEEIKTIPEMRKSVAEFEAKIEKLFRDYEAKLSTLAAEVLRLKKNGGRRKDLPPQSDGIDDLPRKVPSCPEVGQGMEAQRIGDQCLYFSFESQRNWTSAHHRCQQLGWDLAEPKDIVPLKTFLHQTYIHGPSLWLGASYDLDDVDTAAVDANVAAPPVLPSNLQDDKKPSSGFSQGTGISSASSSNALESNGDDLSIILGPAMALEADNGDGATREVRGTAGSLRRLLDQDAMFDEGFLSNKGRIALPRRFLKPHQNTLSKSVIRGFPGESLKETIRDASVVDFILLEEPVEPPAPLPDASSDHILPEYSNMEERSIPVNLTAADIPLDDPSSQSRNTSRERPPLGDEIVQENGVSEILEIGESKGTRKARMKCMLLQQKESLEYELIGRPCNEVHSFVCDMKFILDNLVPE